MKLSLHFFSFCPFRRSQTFSFHRTHTPWVSGNKAGSLILGPVGARSPPPTNDEAAIRLSLINKPTGEVSVCLAQCDNQARDKHHKRRSGSGPENHCHTAPPRRASPPPTQRQRLLHPPPIPPPPPGPSPR